MRTAAESVANPAPPSLTLDLLEQELNSILGMPLARVHAFRAAVAKRWDNCQTCGQLMVQSSQAMEEVFKEAALDESAVATIRMCLGSVQAPHIFPPETCEVKNDHDVCKGLSKKGGGTTERCETLGSRRPDMKACEYFPPAQFDAHRLGALTRNESKLRTLIVQEVCALCDTHVTRHASPALSLLRCLRCR